jgi:uncharacterized protein
MPRMFPERPLSENELDELEKFLASEAGSENCMDISTLHGFITALAIGPGLVLPSEWLPVVWGNDEGIQIASSKQAGRILVLIMQLYNEVLRTLDETPEEFEPILLEGETPEGKLEPIAEAWCDGFLEGMLLRRKEWDSLFADEESAILLGPILVFTDPKELQQVLDSPKRPKRTREDLVDIIPLSVVSIYSYWLAHREPLGPRMTADSTLFARNPKVGRNDPCPCGSGKKYKKCCGLRPQ